MLLGLAACARRSEFLGRVQIDGSPATDAGLPDPDGGLPAPGSPDAPAAPWPCPSVEPTAPSLPPPAWNCAGVERCLRDPLVDPATFVGATPEVDPTRRPALVYPAAGSIHPPNLPRITLQWRRGSPSQTAFRLRIQPVGGAGEAPYDLYVPYQRPTGATPIEELDASHEVGPAIWRYIAQQNAGKAVELTVLALDPTASRSAVSEPTVIRFAPAPVEGGLYYLGTEPPSRGIHRHVFGALTAQAVVPPSSAANAFDCGGCHSVSRDGTTLAFAATYAGNLTVARTDDLDHPTKRPPMPPPDTADAIAPTVSPDGRFILARHGTSDSLVVYDADTGAPRSAVSTEQTGGRIDFPEWSPDGREIVATRARATTQPAERYSASDGQLVVLAVSGGQLSPPEVLVEEPTQVHAYPSWSPDAQWIVFVSSPVGAESRKHPQARLRLVRRHGDRTVLDLTTAMGGQLGLGTTLPRFAPTGQQACQLLFITFHSRMDYGLLRRNRTAPEGGWPQLWMSALDLTRPTDPSTPPIRLPFQDINQKNVMPSWSAEVPCTANTCGPNATCQSGECTPRFD